MTFALTPAAPFTASVSTITAATANDWRTYISQSLDTVNGGAYVNVTSIDWSAGGAGWRFYAALAIKSTGSLTLDAGATVTLAADATVSSGGGWDFEGGSLCRFRGTAGGATLQVDDNAIVSCAGDVTWTGTSTQTHASSSTDTYSSGSTLSLGGNTTWASTSVCVHESSSTDTYQSGSSLTTNSGAIVNLTIGKTNAGTVTNGSLCVEVHESSSTDTYQSGSNLNLDGTVTRTGKEVLSGTGAYTALRYYAAPTGTYSIDPKHYDRIYRTSGPGFANVLTLTPDPGASDFVELFITYVENAGSSLELRDAAATLITTLEFSATSEDKVCAHIIWTGTFWRVLNKTFFS